MESEDFTEREFASVTDTPGEQAEKFTDAMN